MTVRRWKKVFLSVLHNMFKRWKEYERFSTHNRQKQKLRCWTLMISTVSGGTASRLSNIGSWYNHVAKDYSGKAFPNLTLQSYVHKCHLQHNHASCYSCPEAGLTSLGSEASGMEQQTVKTYIVRFFFCFFLFGGGVTVISNKSKSQSLR